MATNIYTMPTGRLAAPRPATNSIKTTIRNATGSGTFMRLPLLWLQRRSWRAELRALDAAQLRDCGLDPDAVAREAMKPFWRD
jgi:uncharacterized protein YjiS (DUF1127 family)